ncbi:MAG: ABC transporter ATP-binding protein [Mesorhizobium sp.]
MSDVVLQVDKLSAWYGEIAAISNIDLQVRRGETVAILGRNGAGKTTLLKSIIGIIRQRKGSVVFDGEDITSIPLHRVAHRGIGYVPEERGIFPSLTVMENLMLPPASSASAMSTEEILELFPNLAERSKSQGTKLSGGEQQMLAIARILRTGPKLLLLDEPTEGIAPVIVQRIAQLIRTLQARGMSILLVEQNFRFARSLASNFYVLESGSVLDSFRAEELETRYDDLNKILSV